MNSHHRSSFIDGERCSSVFDQANVARARTLARIFRGELDTLSFAEQLEDGTAHRAPMEEVFDAAFVADEPESLVDEEPGDCPGRHTRSPPFRPLEDISRGTQPATGRNE